jgi:predicted DNA-binding protein (MmcQ/YjbR family)
MDIDTLREHCLSKPGTEETLPFGPDVLVFKVKGKVYLLWRFEADPPSFNVKCDPDLAEELRGEYPCVQPGFHMNKKHWNTIIIDGSVSNAQLKKWVDHSYDLVSGAGKTTKTKKK